MKRIIDCVVKGLWWLIWRYARWLWLRLYRDVDGRIHFIWKIKL